MVRARLLWRKLLLSVIVVLFCVSVINNHTYLVEV